MEEIIFKTSVDTGNTVKDLQAVEKELKDISGASSKMGTDVEQKFQAINDKVAKGGLSVREYSKQIREYQSIALEAGRTSPIGIEALSRAAALQDELGDLRNEVTRLSQDGAKLQGALQLGSTITAGYGAAQGAMALMGQSGEDLQKTLVKLQSATAILNGIEQIRLALEKESQMMIQARNLQTKILTVTQTVYTAAVGTTTGAMKALRIAMLALPIVAIIAGITALVYWMASSKDGAKTLEESYDELTASMQRNQDQLDRQQKSLMRNIDNQIKLAKSNNATDEEMHKLKMERIRQEEVARLQQVQNTEYNLQDMRQLYQRAIREGDEDKAKSIKAEIQAERKKYKDLKALQGQYRVDLQVSENERRNELEQKEKEESKKSLDNAKKRQKEREDAARKQLELQRTIQDLALANMVEGEEKQRAELALQQQRERDDIIAKYGKNTTLLKELEIKQKNELNDLELKLIADEKALKDASTKKEQEDALKLKEQEAVSKRAELEGKLIQMRDNFEAEQELKRELALMDMEQQLLDSQAKETAMLSQLELSDEEKLAQASLFEGERFKIKQEYAQKIDDLNKAEIEAEEKKNEAIQVSRQQLGNAIADVFGQIAGLSKEGSKAAKTFALAEIGINTAIGFVQGLRLAQRAALTSPTPILTYGIFAAQQVGAVLSAASQAKKILGASSSVTAPNVSGGGGSSSVQTEQGQTRVDRTESNLTSGLQDTAQRVYVVDSDITAVQNSTRKAQAVSTIG
jgi:hypothetical protein